MHPERCVFCTIDLCSSNTIVGNIPYRATEEDVRPILQSVGPVIRLEYEMCWFFKGRLKRDPTTGLCSGIGFCEFGDEETAELAKRMNNKKSIKGRLLRIDNPDGGKKGVTAAVCIHNLFHCRLHRATSLVYHAKNVIACLSICRVWLIPIPEQRRRFWSRILAFWMLAKSCWLLIVWLSCTLQLFLLSIMCFVLKCLILPFAEYHNEVENRSLFYFLLIMLREEVVSI